MELSDSPDERLTESSSRNKEETRSPLGIDLNEIPAASGFGGSRSSQEPEPDPVDVVRAIHDNPDPAPGPPAEVPGPDRDAACVGCGRPEGRDLVVVCDGCERGFHLGCVNGGITATTPADWICGDCVDGGVRSKRWQLGVKSKLILDINASPPSDMDGEGEEEVTDLRKQMSGDSSFGSNAFGASLTYSKFLYLGKGYGCHKASGIMPRNPKVGLKDVFGSHAIENFQDVGLGFPLGSLGNGNSLPTRFPSWNPSEVFLQALSDFIFERHGILEEGWRVDLTQSLDGYGMHAVYTAPDGKTFGSMQEVACYLGLTANGIYSSLDTDIRTEGSTLQERLHLPKKRKTPRFPINSFLECEESLPSGQSTGFPFTGKSMANYAFKSSSFAQATEYGTGGNSGRVYEETNDGLPLQFEDFFVLSLGQVDVRPSYHDLNLIYPVGYRSCWHDKITGSLFTCEVSDGGVSGPVFRVRRSSCAELSIPVASTVLFCPKFKHTSQQNNEERDDIRDHDCDFNIEILLSDSSPPVGDDLLTCLGNGHHFQSFDSLQQEAGPVCDKINCPLSGNLEFRDEIGEILVEENSLYAAWKRMSQKLIDTCSEILKQRGTLKFLCKHGDKETGSTNWDMIDEKKKMIFSSLSKFCSSRAPLVIPSEYRAKTEVGTLADVLSRWLDQDRFGLDVDFVQEMIEHLPGVESCLRYEFLKSRSSYSASASVGNGLLHVKSKGGENKKNEAMNGFPHKAKKHTLDHDCVMGNSCPPPGKPLCLRLPPVLVGDFLQVFEVFRRFHEILGLEEPFSLEKLEEELINPWFDGLDLGKFKKEVHRSEINSSDVDHTARKILYSSNETCPAVSTENSPAFVQMETEMTAEASESISQSRCFGVVLTKAHISLLQVLMCELQSKVAAFVDPNFDSGESRSRRGRKKDADIPLPAKRTKLRMLPVNELTWPELARRYILSVLSMDGNLESAEIAARESGKVFRCLRGDGGLLCGSLMGVAGMEADAILLAEAAKRIFDSLKRENVVLTIEDEESDDVSAFEKNACNGGIPEWAHMLEPVRKLPTNVGTRIRKCVYDALDKNPPEWAKKILEHSISKEVYKGNASGPTKKAVLSLLADVHNGEVVRKCEKGTKKKSLMSASDIIMKQCRIVLRRVIAADDEKVLCNLLGRKLPNSNDNDDEGLLGSPGMVSRPLDFRTIDLRLAVGAYGGSHEAFLEDVRELWNNIHAVYADQPDCTELAETLSQKFESLYEDEVLTLGKKLVEYAKSECVSADMKKDINDIIASTSKLPKAPWDEGVCKVCGIDRDDDSVLLCDTCDAEYHTYCLNPPLIRIPEGNWYCPSCVVGKHMFQDASESYKLISRRKHRKYQGEVTRVHLESITHLAAVMENKEYWNFCAQERVLLLKFLCDELLSSALVHQHLEQCAEAVAELQQKLRSLSVEWKNLKSREEYLAAKVAKVETSMLNEVGEGNLKAGLASGSTDNGTCVVQLENPGVGEGISLDDSGKQSSDTFSEKNQTHKSQCNASFDGGSQPKDAHAISDDRKVPQDSETFSRLNELPLPSTYQGIDNLSSLTPENLQKSMGKDHDGLPLASNESQACQELNTTKNDILHLQESIRSIESQLLKQSVRREFLGSDSGGCLYWVSTIPGGHPRITVDGSMSLEKSAWLHNNTDLTGSKAPSPFLLGVDHSRITHSPWLSYGTDGEIEELVRWLMDNGPKERELRESILSWKKFRFWDSQNARSQVQNSPALAVSRICPVTEATMSLVKKYGPCAALETEALKKGGKKARVTKKETMYRCHCLEPILPSLNHCLICHKTFSTDGKFEEHNDGKCIPAPPANDESKEICDSLKGKGNLKSDHVNQESNARKDPVETSKGSELSYGLIRYQTEGSACPYHFEEICSKFVTKDSNEELVQEIGLIGSNGIPSLVPSLSPVLSNSMLMLDESKEQDGPFRDDVRSPERPTLLESNRHGDDSQPDMSSKRFSVNDFSDILKANRVGLGHPERKNRKSSGSPSTASGFESCCVVPQISLRPLVGIASSVVKKLKISLLDMDAALPEEALRPSKAHLECRWAWRAFVKYADRIYELVQATIVLEDMIKAEYLRNEWWYWSSLSAAAKISTVSALALRIYSLDAAIMYDKSLSQSDTNDDLKPTRLPDQNPLTISDTQEKGRMTRRFNKKRKEQEG